MKGGKGVGGLSIHEQPKKFRTFSMFDNIIARRYCRSTGERRSEAFVKIKKKKIFFLGGGGGGGLGQWGGVGWGRGQGGCEWRSEAFVESQKKNWGGGGRVGGIGLGGQGGCERRSELFSFFLGGGGVGGRVRGRVRGGGGRNGEVKLL